MPAFVPRLESPRASRNGYDQTTPLTVTGGLIAQDGSKYGEIQAQPVTVVKVFVSFLGQAGMGRERRRGSDRSPSVISRSMITGKSAYLTGNGYWYNAEAESPSLLAFQASAHLGQCFHGITQYVGRGFDISAWVMF